jgi:hypothetical protein
MASRPSSTASSLEEMSTDSLTMPTAGPSTSRGPVPAALPWRCRETAGQDADVAEEDGIQQQPVGVQPFLSVADLDNPDGSADEAASAQVMEKRSAKGKGKQKASPQAIAVFTSSHGCESLSFLHLSYTEACAQWFIFTRSVFSKELARERRAYLTIVLRPLLLITLLMWACLPV